MITHEIALKLAELDRKGITVYSKSDLVTMLECKSAAWCQKLIRCLVNDGMLERVARGIYHNRLACSRRGYLIEEIACVIRRGHFNYVSLESILSEFGVISQIMMSRITIMTSGSSGVFHTPYGTFEFTHTARSFDDLRSRTVRLEGRPLLLATKEAGVADLRRVGRNLGMIDYHELESDDMC